MSEKKEVGYVFQFAANVADGMSLTINGNFPVGAAAVDMNVEVDKIRAVFQRQRAKNNVMLIKAGLEAKQAQLRNAELDFKHQASDSKMDKRVIERTRQMIDELKREIEMGEAELARTDAEAV